MPGGYGYGRGPGGGGGFMSGLLGGLGGAFLGNELFGGRRDGGNFWAMSAGFGGGGNAGDCWAAATRRRWRRRSCGGRAAATRRWRRGLVAGANR